MSIFHRHKWTDWVVADRGDTLFCHDVVGWYLTQQRYCTTCGKTQISDQSDYGGKRGSSFASRRSTMSARAPRKDGVKV